MMDHTPIEALFHHSANCPCDSCKKIIKPYQNGTFVRKEDIDTMNKSIQELLQENSRIQAALDQSNQQKVAMEQYIQQLLQTIQAQTTPSQVQVQSTSPQQVVTQQEQQEEEEEEDESDDEEEYEEEKPSAQTKSKKQRNITISIDTSKLFYIGIIIVIAIMVLKK